MNNLWGIITFDLNIHIENPFPIFSLFITYRPGNVKGLVLTVDDQFILIGKFFPVNDTAPIL